MKINRSLALSIVLNLILLALAGYSLTRNPPVPAAKSGAAEFPHPAVQAPPQAPAPTLNWSQLESEDYRDYMSNLRSIDCPQRIIQDIVTADLGRVYDEKREAAAASNHSPFELREALAKLGQEQSAAIESLFGPTLRTSARESGQARNNEIAPPAFQSETGKHTSEVAAEPQISMPLVFLDHIPNMNWNDQQISAFDSLRNEFLSDLSQTSQSPTDPAYLNRWLEEQPKLDERFRAWFGDEAFNQFQIQANNAAQ